MGSVGSVSVAPAVTIWTWLLIASRNVPMRSAQDMATPSRSRGDAVRDLDELATHIWMVQSISAFGNSTCGRQAPQHVGAHPDQRE